MNLIFASNNAHKLEEARAILPAYHILSLAEIGCHEEIPETQPTLQGNSLQKAEFVYNWCREHLKKLPADILGCFADDTGLEIEALNGDPGVYTARWAGEPACDANNRKKALAQLANQTNRNARFRTVITLIENGKEQQVVGEVKGIIATQESGDKGFGYDSLFIPNGYDKTFAELPAEVKNSISHRANALAKLAQIL